MADYISQITLPDESTYELKDANAARGNGRIFYGTCATAAGTVPKEVICNQYDILTIGDILIVKFANTNSATANDNLKLQIKNTNNGTTTEAKAIKQQYNSTGNNNLNAVGQLNANGISAFVYNGTYWILLNGNYNNTYTITSVYCNTAAATAAKTFSNATYYTTNDKSYFEITFRYANSVQSALTLNGKTLYINGEPTSATNYTLPAGKYLVYYDNNIYYIRTDGKITGDITGDAATATNAANTQSNYGAKSFIVEGDADTYYPVIISGQTAHNAWTLLNITRGYGEQAPDTWNTSTHRGGLTLTILTNGDSAWGGNHKIGVKKLNTILDLSEEYCTMVADIVVTNFGLVIWLRGGNAKYWITSNGGQSVTITPKYAEYTASNNTVSPRTTINTDRINEYRWNNLWTVANATTAVNLSVKPSLTANNNNITVTAGGKTSDAFTVPYATNTDNSVNSEKVTTKLDTTHKAYLLGTTTAPTAAGVNVAPVGDTGVYLTSTAGQLNATSYKVNEKVIQSWNATSQCLEFQFV